MKANRKYVVIAVAVIAASLGAASVSAFGGGSGVATPAAVGPAAGGLGVFAGPAVDPASVPELVKEVADSRHVPDFTHTRRLGVYGAASIYAFPESGSGACAAILVAGTGVGACALTLEDASGTLSVQESVVGGGTYVWGLAADGVTAVTVTLSGKTYVATIADNMFAVQIPDGSHGTDAISVSATSGAVTNTQSVAGIPAPSATPAD